jgi:MFS family permease
MARPAPAREEDPDAGRRQPLRHLAVTFTTQMLAAGGFIFFALIVPELARETGLPERDFGLAVTFIFIGTALSSPLTGFYTRIFGSVGAQLLALAWMAGALLLVLLGTWWTTMLAGTLFGMGYGPLSPLGMTIVTERTPHKNRGLFLSIRQSSQPLAGVLLGRLLPPFVLAYGWQAGVISISASVAAGILVVALWPALFRLRDEAAIRSRSRAPSAGGGSLAGVLARFAIPRELRALWLSGVIFAITQVVMVFFCYIYLLEEIGLSPIAAGIFASNLQLAGLFSRPVSGWICDRLGRSDVVLIAIAIVSVIASAALLTVTRDWGAAPLLAVALACGVSGQAWNAVFTNAMAELVAPERLAEMNGRAFAFLSLGWMAAAPACWLLIETFADYRPIFYTVIALNVIVTISLVFGLRRGRQRTVS